MANRRAIVKRRKAVRNIHKITRTMQLIAMARFQAAMSRAIASRPYAQKLAELVADLASAGEISHPLMATPSPPTAAMLVLTSDRGLCGGYNAGVLRAAMQQLDELAEAGVSTDVHMVGKKGLAAFRFRRRPIAEHTSNIGDQPRFEQVEPIASGLIDRFVAGEIRAVYVVYTRFYSPGKRQPEVMQLLPLADPAAVADRPARQPAYEFLPSTEELVDQLLPASVRMRLFQCFNDAAVSEQIARMIAMKAATEAASDMIKLLTRQYNRARQTHITMELLDIVGGASALSDAAS